MDCWTDNIMCDATQCSTDPDYIRKFINPSNTGAYAGCLKMKYDNSTTGGAEFIRWKRPRRTCWRSRTACTRCRRR